MKQNNYHEPQINHSAFTCPHCGVYAKQAWFNLFAERFKMEYFRVCYCEHCGEWSIWLKNKEDANHKMIYPANSNLPEPNEDLPEDIKTIYIEAKNIHNQSPRAACALLRLAIQKLCIILGEKGDNLNDDIAKLVKKGLSSEIQQALDTVRVIGNNAVHPGEINIEDDLKMSTVLFDLVNIIADKMISEPKQIEALYSKLPQKQLDQIEKRDNKN